MALEWGSATEVYLSQEGVLLTFFQFFFFFHFFVELAFCRGKMASGGAAPAVTLIKRFDQLLQHINEADPEKVSARDEIHRKSGWIHGGGSHVLLGRGSIAENAEKADGPTNQPTGRPTDRLK